MELFNKQYQYWAKLIESQEIPEDHIIRKTWDTPFCDRFCETCPKPLMCHISLYPPVEYVSDETWTSPSDLLVGKVKMKPPFTNKYKKAITHKGILEIGHEFENDIWNNMEREKRRALWEQELLLKFMFEKQKQIKLSQTRDEERERCNEAMEKLSQKLERKLAKELKKLEAKMLRARKKLLGQVDEEIRIKWEARIDEVIEESVGVLTKAFLEIVQKHAKELQNTYLAMHRQQIVKSQFMTDMERVRCDDMLRHLKHVVECNNISNLMYLLCSERHKCQAEMDFHMSKYKMDIDRLQETLTKHEEELEKLTADRDIRLQQLLTREEGIVQILRKFQKFINFALKCTPTQGEFLLNLERMIECELAAMPPVETKRKEPLDYSRILEMKEGITASSSGTSGVVAEDYHDCYDEHDPPPKPDGELRESDTLPAFFVKERMYVREDLRNMFSRGIAVSSDHSIWNREVDNLMKLLKVSVTDLTLEADDAKSMAMSMRSQQNQTRRSSVHFPKVEGTAERKPSLKLPSAESKTSHFLGESRLSILRTSKTSDEIGLVELRQVPVLEHSRSLICTRNSLELILEKHKQQVIEKEQEERNEAGIETRTSQMHTTESYFKTRQLLEKPQDLEVASQVTEASRRSKECMIVDALQLGSQELPASRKSSDGSPRRRSILSSRGSVEEAPKDSINVGLDMLVEEDEPPEEFDRNFSKLSMHRDSMELARMVLSSKMSGGYLDKESVEILDGGIIQEGKSRSSIIKLDDLGDRAVRMSHIEVVEIPQERSGVLINPQAVVVSDELLEEQSDKQREKKRFKRERRKPLNEILEDQVPLAQIAGDRDAKEHIQTQEDFTMTRIESMLAFLERNPSLIKSFKVSQ